MTLEYTYLLQTIIYLLPKKLSLASEVANGYCVSVPMKRVTHNNSQLFVLVVAC